MTWFIENSVLDRALIWTRKTRLSVARKAQR